VNTNQVSLLALSLFAVAEDPKLEQQEVGPVAQDVQYVVSARNAHLATVGRKGSRMVVTIDGVSGPKFDEILPARPYVDPRNSPPEMQQPQPVVFSPDGSRYAYVGRQSQELVLFVDGKESLRTPMAGISGVEVRVAFGGDDAKHIYYAQSCATGFELWIDGQKQPGSYLSSGSGESATDPVITRDGAHWAYVAQIERDKRTLVLDGKDAGYLGESPQFTADGQHFFCLVRQGPIVNLVVDGKPKVKSDGINRLCMAPAGNGFAAVLQRLQPPGEFLIMNGKKVEGSDCLNITRVVLSPDGKRCAALCVVSNQAQFVLVDGKKGLEYFNIIASSIAFSPDSSKLGYVATAGAKAFVVINEDESDEFQPLPSFAFSADGKRVVYTGSRSGSAMSFPVFVDDKPEQLSQGMNIDSFEFSPDGSRYAYLGPGANNGEPILVDGKNSGLCGRFKFSPDSQHFACAGYRAADGKRGLFVDGTLVYANERDARSFAFTPDSKHLCWISSEADAFVTYVDGQAVARCDNTLAFTQLEALPPLTRLGPDGQMHMVKELPSGWQVGPDGVLTLLGPVGAAVQRFRVTPAADSSLATLLAKAPK